MNYSRYQSNEVKELKQLFLKTFTDSEGQAEGITVSDLAYDLMTTTDNEDLLIFVATEKEKKVGCIVFTTITCANAISAFLLSPVAILTDYQGRGIGKELIKFGLKALQDQGTSLAFTYGDPKFYSQVGFTQISELQIKAPLKLTYPEGWLCQSLISNKIESIEGDSYCVEALNKQSLW